MIEFFTIPLAPFFEERRLHIPWWQSAGFWYQRGTDRKICGDELRHATMLEF